MHYGYNISQLWKGKKCFSLELKTERPVNLITSPRHYEMMIKRLGCYVKVLKRLNKKFLLRAYDKVHVS